MTLVSIISLKRELESIIDLDEIPLEKPRSVRYDYFFENEKLEMRQGDHNSPCNTEKLVVFQFYNNSLTEFDYQKAKDLHENCPLNSNGRFNDPYTHAESCECGALSDLLTADYQELGKLIDRYFLEHQIEQKLQAMDRSGIRIIRPGPKKKVDNRRRRLDLKFDLELQVDRPAKKIYFAITGQDTPIVQQRFEQFTIGLDVLESLFYFFHTFRTYDLNKLTYYTLKEIIGMGVPEMKEFLGFDYNIRHIYFEIDKVKDVYDRFMGSIGEVIDLSSWRGKIPQTLEDETLDTQVNQIQDQRSK